MGFPPASEFGLFDGVDVEPGIGTQLAFWVPGMRDCDLMRVVGVTNSDQVTMANVGFLAAEATPMQVEQSGGWWRQLRRCFTRDDDATWLTPHGRRAEPAGEKQLGLALTWSTDSLPLSEARILAACPEAEVLKQLGTHLYLVRGVLAVSQGTQSDLQDSGIERTSDQEQFDRQFNFVAQAKKALDRSRRSSNDPQEVIALVDLGAACLRSGQKEQGVEHLEQALAKARERGDLDCERDILGNLGIGYLEMRRGDDAIGALEEALAMAQAAGDRFLEKMMLNQIGNAWSLAMEPRRAQGYFEAAYRIAEEQHDRQTMADLLWRTAVCHDELDDQSAALVAVERSIELQRAVGLPITHDQTSMIEQLRTKTPTRQLSAAAPSRLRMALSAATAFARFASSGFKKVPPSTREARLAVCDQCDYHTGVRCRACGCFTAQKTWLPHEQCPLQKWEE